MNTTDTKHRNIGVFFSENEKGTARVWSPDAARMDLLLNDGSVIPMAQEMHGYWRVNSEKLHPGVRYQFSKNGGDPLPDPASLSQPDGVHKSSEVFDATGFEWTDKNWKNHPLNDYIIYEIHTGTFTPSGNFEGIESKLDYLVSLGITAIEIMPVAQFPGSRNWGYDGVFPFAVQSTYGGAKALQHLIDTAHQKGLSVILDVVYNHLGPEGNYLGAYGPYFTDKYGTPWGQAVNYDDAWCDGVRNFVIENVLMCFRDFHVDALRMDAVHAIKDFSPVHLLKDIRLHVDKLMHETGRKHHLIVECDLNDTRFINPVEKDGGYGMDAQWMDEFHHALRVASGQKREGYYADFNGLPDLAKSFRDAYVFDGQFSEHRHKYFGTETENAGEQFIVFSQNHDQVGNRMLGERTSTLLNFEMQKLLAGVVLFSPFMPLLFMGEEYGETNPFLYFVSHTDPQLVEAVREGRKAEFEAFHALGEAPDPQAEETFERSKLQWNLLNETRHQTLFRYYQTLIKLRKEILALAHLERKNVKVSLLADEQVLILQRRHESSHFCCFFNFSEKPQTVSLPEENFDWKMLLDSASSEWNGNAAEANILAGNERVKVPPQSLIAFINS